MNTPNSSHPIQKVKEPVLLDSVLDELGLEIKALFSVLDDISKSILKIEKYLTDSKVNIPFSLSIKEEKESSPKPIQEHHLATYASVDYVTTKTLWHLSWQLDENSKVYRLFLIINEREFAYYDSGDGSYLIGVSDLKHIFKKTLYDTDLQTRLECSRSLYFFIDAFKEHLKNYRVSIESSDLPF
ncbi:MAG: hypothetical protein P4L31_02590 [Candidatus Babeliales bacterium]|nr:hypothetical protein [Candidatus Babeliales bacterium]